MQKNEIICDSLLIALRKIIRAIDLHSKQLVQKYGLTGPQMLLLKIICDQNKQELTSSDIAKTASLSQATVTSILDRLTEKGFATREKSSSDRRKVIIRSSESAEKIFKQNPSLLQEDFIRQFEKLRDWEQLAMLSSLERMAEMMHAKTLDAAPVLANTDLTSPNEIS